MANAIQHDCGTILRCMHNEEWGYPKMTPRIFAALIALFKFMMLCFRDSVFFVFDNIYILIVVYATIENKTTFEFHGLLRP